MVRKFKLINEKGQEFSLMDIYNYCLLTDPSGLGYGYDIQYQTIGNSFIEDLRTVQQGQISATLNFLNYDNYAKLINFVESSESLRFVYEIPYSDGTYKQYYKDINMQIISKTQLQTNGILSESVTFDCLSLWYEENTTIYTTGTLENGIRWDFDWDSYFTDYSSRTLQFVNQGHVEAPIYVEIDGAVKNPEIQLYVEGKLYKKVKVNIDIQKYEKFYYDSRENSFEITKQNTDGSTLSLLKLSYIDFENDIIIRIPKGKSCEIRIEADNEITQAKVVIYPQYLAV